MENVNIEAILIIQRNSGLPLLLQKLDPRVFDIDPALVSGFLFAIQAFSSEVFEANSSDLQIDYGKRLFTILIGNEIMMVAISSGGRSNEITPIVEDLLHEFESNWYVELEYHGDIDGSGKQGDSSLFDGFRAVVIEKLGLQGMSLNWVPSIIEINSSVDLSADCQFLELVNGKNSVGNIVQDSGIAKSEVIFGISRLWALGLVRFSNTLDRCDVIITTSALFRYLQKHTKECRDITQFSNDLVNLLPQVIKYFNGKTTVEGFLHKYSESAYALLDFLLRKRAIEILSPEKKRILMVKELLQKSLEVACETYSKNLALIVLRSIIMKNERPEIVAEIQVDEGTWKIDYGFQVYDGLNPHQVMDLHSAWIALLKEVVTSLPDKKRKKYVENLVDVLKDNFFDKYTSSELDGFDEFSLILESELV